MIQYARPRRQPATPTAARRVIASLLSLTLWILALPFAQAAAPDLRTAIDAFVEQQFPQAKSHHWVVNQTSVEADEVTVDVKAVVTVPSRSTPLEERFLLLFVKGKLAAAQLIPLEGDPDCQKEEA